MKEFIIKKNAAPFFGLKLPEGSVCGRYIYRYTDKNGRRHKRVITYVLKDFQPIQYGKNSLFYRVLIYNDKTGKWYETTTNKTSALRKLSEMLACNLYLNGLESDRRYLETPKDRAKIRSVCPKMDTRQLKPFQNPVGSNTNERYTIKM